MEETVYYIDITNPLTTSGIFERQSASNPTNYSSCNYCKLINRLKPRVDAAEKNRLIDHGLSPRLFFPVKIIPRTTIPKKKESNENSRVTRRRLDIIQNWPNIPIDDESDESGISTYVSVVKIRFRGKIKLLISFASFEMGGNSKMNSRRSISK